MTLYGGVPGPVRDFEGAALDLEDRPLGRGGQGVVYRVRGTKFAIKLVEESGRSRPEQGLDRRLRRLGWLPLDGIPITMPRRRLAPPHVGYLMDLLEDMEPLERLCISPEATDPWYAETGGLRRRLRLLSACADAVARLHSRGLVYGDLSPANVFIAADPKQDRLRLIDADNIAVETSARGRIVGTLRYSAPEICTGRSGNTPFSDAYSLATLAYEVLAADHPFGDLMEDEDDQEAVHYGQEPWALHSADDRNRSKYGVAPEKALSERLQRLLKRNFEDGLLDPVARPTAAEWAEALDQAADRTVDCAAPDCGHSYLANRGSCPFCGTGRTPVLAVALWDLIPVPTVADGGRTAFSELRQVVALQRGRTALLTDRHARFAPEDRTAPRLSLRWDGGDVAITNTGTGAVRLTAGRREELLRPGAAAETSVETMIHFGPSGEIHRIAKFQPDAWG